MSLRSRFTLGARPALAAVAIGLVVGGLTAFAVIWQATLLLGWDAAAIVFLTLTWMAVGGLDGKATKAVATREDPRGALADAIIIGAGLACLGAMGLVLVKAAHAHGGTKALLICLA